MFRKKDLSVDDSYVNISQEPAVKEISKKASNTILKGNRLIGDITVTCDLELSGDIEGNIISKTDSNIIIKGSCHGDIETKGGTVEIEGELLNGNINAGSNVRIIGKFSGGEVVSEGRIFVDGQFSGRLEGKEIEIGPHAQGKGELLYKESISIAKGARIEGQISQAQQELVLLKTPVVEKNLEKQEDNKEVGNS